MLTFASGPAFISDFWLRRHRPLAPPNEARKKNEARRGREKCPEGGAAVDRPPEARQGRLRPAAAAVAVAVATAGEAPPSSTPNPTALTHSTWPGMLAEAGPRMPCQLRTGKPGPLPELAARPPAAGADRRPPPKTPIPALEAAGPGAGASSPSSAPVRANSRRRPVLVTRPPSACRCSCPRPRRINAATSSVRLCSPPPLPARRIAARDCGAAARPWASGAAASNEAVLRFVLRRNADILVNGTVVPANACEPSPCPHLCLTSTSTRMRPSSSGFTVSGTTRGSLLRVRASASCPAATALVDALRYHRSCLREAIAYHRSGWNLLALVRASAPSCPQD